MQTLYQELQTSHDKNGNRRALYLEYDLTGDVIAIHKYNNGLPKRLYNSTPLPKISVGVEEYKYWLKRGKESTRILFYNE